MPKGSIVLAGTNAIRAALCVLLATSTDNVVVIHVIAVPFAAGSQFAGLMEARRCPRSYRPRT